MVSRKPRCRALQYGHRMETVTAKELYEAQRVVDNELGRGLTVSVALVDGQLRYRLDGGEDAPAAETVQQLVFDQLDRRTAIVERDKALRELHARGWSSRTTARELDIHVGSAWMPRPHHLDGVPVTVTDLVLGFDVEVPLPHDTVCFRPDDAVDDEAEHELIALEFVLDYELVGER